MRKESSLFFPFPSGSNLSKVTKSREQNKEFILFLPRRSKFGEARVTKSRWKNQEKYHFAPSFHVFATVFQALSSHCCKMRRLSHVIFEKRKKKVGSCRSPAYLCNRNNKRQATCHSMNPFKKVQFWRRCVWPRWLSTWARTRSKFKTIVQTPKLPK